MALSWLFRRNAELCKELAATAKSIEVRDQWVELAQAWQKKAAADELLEKTATSAAPHSANVTLANLEKSPAPHVVREPLEPKVMPEQLEPEATQQQPEPQVTPDQPTLVPLETPMPTIEKPPMASVETPSQETGSQALVKDDIEGVDEFWRWAIADIRTQRRP
jgi:hypothetical protein